MKSSGVFMVGLLVGAVAALAISRVRRGETPEDAERLSLRMAEHLRKLESRLNDVMHSVEHASPQAAG